MAETLLFLTELLGLPVYDLKGRRLGRVRDSAVVPLADPFRATAHLLPLMRLRASQLERATGTRARLVGALSLHRGRA